MIDTVMQTGLTRVEAAAAIADAADDHMMALAAEARKAKNGSDLPTDGGGISPGKGSTT